jgi:hypothetical protein
VSLLSVLQRKFTGDMLLELKSLKPYYWVIS